MSGLIAHEKVFGGGGGGWGWVHLAPPQIPLPSPFLPACNVLDWRQWGRFLPHMVVLPVTKHH